MVKIIIAVKGGGELLKSSGSNMVEPSRHIPVSRKILDDAPGTEDKFSGGGHGRTARALARAIWQSRDSDQVIGLEGSWGAGKSTIVKLAERELRNGTDDQTYHVFTYDLWSNQTGHFKRSFLEAFLNWALVAFPRKKAKINDRQAQISNKVKTVDSDFFRRFSWFGVATIVFLYFTPVIYGWLSPAGFKDPSGNGTVVTGGVKLAWIALGLYGVAMLLAVLFAFPWKKDVGFRAGTRDAISRALSIFSKEAEKTTVTQTIRDEDPTQYEFNRIFRGIVGELCGQKDRIVVVFDNVDRLPQTRIPDAWSEVRAALSDEVNGNGNAKITAIIPYARPIALSAFKVQSDSGTEKSETKPDMEGDYLRADVFRKSFDVIFAVAPPVLSDAANFFAVKFREATIASIDEQVVRRVYRIFDLHVQNSGNSVTPRQVIAFINDVTNWWEQWEGRIPLETIAVFVAHQDKLLANPTTLRKADGIDARMIQHAGQPEIRRHLAALSFNVEPDLAFQILLHDAIRRALIAPDNVTLQELVDSAEANGFFEILPTVIDESITIIAVNTSDFLNGLSNIATLKANLDDLQYTRKSFVNAFYSFNEPILSKWLEHSSIWNLIGFVERSALLDLTQRFTMKIASTVDEEKATFVQGREWIKVIDKLLAAVELHHGSEARAEIAKSIVPLRSAEAIIGIAMDCDQTSCHLSDLGTVRNQPAVFEQLGEYAKGEEAFGYAWPELEFIATTKQKKTLLQVAVTGLQSEALDFGSDELNWYSQAVTLLTASLSRAEGGKDVVPVSLHESGALCYYAHGAWQYGGTPDNQVTADALWLEMLAYGLEPPEIPEIGNRPVFGNVQVADDALRNLFTDNEHDAGLIGRLAKQAIAHGRIDYCFQQACEEEEGQLFLDVARAICEDEAFEIPQAKTLTSCFGDLRTILGESMEKLAASVGSKAPSDYWDAISLDEVPSEMLTFALNREEPGWLTFVGKVDERLKAIDLSVWRAAFATGNNILTLLMIRNTSAPVSLASAEFYEPFLGSCLALIAGKSKLSPNSFDFATLSASLAKPSQSRLVKDFFEQHDVASSGIKAALETLDALLVALPFETKPDLSIERYLLPLIKLKSSKADMLIRNKQEAFRACIKNASEQNRDLVQEYLPNATIASGTNEATEPDERVTTLRAVLGL